MPTNPMRGDVHVNSPLSNISVAYMNRATHMVAPAAFPIVPVSKQSDRYFVYNQGDWMRSEAQVRAPSTESAGSGWKLDNTPNYFADVQAIHKDVDDGVRSNADAAIDMDRDATEYVSQQLMLKRELDWAAAYFATGIWDNDVTPGTLWNAAGGLPVDDVDVGKDTVLKATGMVPNVLVVGIDVHTGLKNNADVKDRIKYTQRATVTEEILASLLGVDKYLVARGINTTSAQGATDVFAPILGAKDALLCYAEPNPGLLKPSAGYTFAWTGYVGAGPQGQRISRFRMDELRSDRIEGEMAYDMKLVASSLGYFFDGAVS